MGSARRANPGGGLVRLCGRLWTCQGTTFLATRWPRWAELEVHQGAGALTLEGDQAGAVGVAHVGGRDVAVEVGLVLVLTVGQPGAAHRFGFLALGLGHLVEVVGLLGTLRAERAVRPERRDDAGIGTHLDVVGPVVHDAPVPVVEGRGQVVQELEVAPHRPVHDAAGAGELDVELVAFAGVGRGYILGVVVAGVDVVAVIVAVVDGGAIGHADSHGHVATADQQGQKGQGEVTHRDAPCLSLGGG